MSRNLRHKSMVTPIKTTSKRTSRTNDNSSDDDYAGVDLISDSEEDEPDVEVAEERAIIDSAEEDDEDLQATPRPSIDDDQSSWNGFEVESEEEYLGENVPFFDEHMARMNPPHLATEDSLYHSDQDVSPTRRVRFDLSDSNTAESDSGDDGLFPDIFLDQNSLDPGFRRMIEKDDNDEDQNSSGNESYWDFRNSDDNSPQKQNEEDESDSSSTGSSGYETDEGETTEEDLPEAASYAPTRSVLRRPSDASSSEEEITVTRRAPIRSRGPRLGQWLHDATKPFAMIDRDSKKLLLFRAVRRRFSFNGVGNRPQVGLVQDLDSPRAILDQDMSPMISNSANLMMSAMHTPFDDFLHGQALGPPEAFYPFTSVSADGTIIQDSPSEYDEDDYDDENLWDVEDFLNFGEESSADEDVEAEDPSSDSPATAAEPSSTPARPTTATSEDQIHPLLNHFNSGVVGAFRRNQTRHQLLSRNTESHASLAFQGPHRTGTIRGIKGGRLQAANTPITPMRKQRASRPLVGPVDSSPLAHLTGGAMEDKKRKFDMEDAVRGHKRSKSLM